MLAQCLENVKKQIYTILIINRKYIWCGMLVVFLLKLDFIFLIICTIYLISFDSHQWNLIYRQNIVTDLVVPVLQAQLN